MSLQSDLARALAMWRAFDDRHASSCPPLRPGVLFMPEQADPTKQWQACVGSWCVYAGTPEAASAALVVYAREQTIGFNRDMIAHHREKLALYEAALRAIEDT